LEKNKTSIKTEVMVALYVNLHYIYVWSAGYGLRGSANPITKVTGLVNGKGQTLTAAESTTTD